jgi:tetratricopeptide (TPR) repeat protein
VIDIIPIFQVGALVSACKTINFQTIQFMSKKRKVNAVIPPEVKKTFKPGLSFSRMYWVALVVVLLIYGKTVGYDFTLDDGLFIQNHSSVQKGLAGIPEIFSQGSMEGNNGSKGLQPYRPLTLTTFAMDIAISGGNPAYSHFVNVLLYVLLSFVIIQWLSTLWPKMSNWLILAICLLFIAHPVHIEVVANIKSRDEILAALFGIKAMQIALAPSFDQKRVASIGVVFLLFLAALLSKESAITLLPIFLLTLLLLSARTKKETIIRLIPFLGAVILFFILRWAALPKATYNESQENIIHNTLFSQLTLSESIGTRLSFLLEYLRLLIFPWPLSWDYSYNQIPVSEIGGIRSLLSLTLHIFLLVFSLILLRRKPVISFGILFYFLAFLATSNVFFIIGATVSERLLFLPSLGFCIFIVFVIFWLLENVGKESSKNTFLLMLPVIIVYSAIGIIHTPVWKNNYELFSAGVKSSPQSARANFAMASVYRELAIQGASVNADSSKFYYEQAIKYYENGLAIYKDDLGLFSYLGSCYYEIGDTLNTIKNYTYVLSRDSTDEFSLHELATIYANRLKPDSSIYFAKRFVNHYPSKIDGYFLLTGSYFSKKEYSTALIYASKAYKLDSTNQNAIRNMAGVMQALGRNEEASFYISRIISK